MNEKIEIMGISLDTCSVEEVIESINVHWLQEESLSTYGTLTMKLFMAAQKDPELKEYIQMLDKAVPDDPEVLWAAGLHDGKIEEEISRHDFMATLFWLLSQYRNRIFILGETLEDAEEMHRYLDEKYPDIVVAGRDCLLTGESDQVDRVINEINAISPQAVLSCSRTFELEKFVKKNRKMINSRVWFSLGNCQEIWKGPGLKPAWLGKIMEKISLKKWFPVIKKKKKEI